MMSTSSFLSYETFKLDPEMLTKFRAPDKELRAYDGRVGSILEGDLLLTSPNMRNLYQPPLNMCQVRQRKDRHFGPDDPIFYPQPFSFPLGHFSLIRTPRLSIEETLYYAWVLPTSADFVASTSGVNCFGKLSAKFITGLQTMCQAVLGNSPKNSDDPHIMDYTGTVGRIVEQLEAAASQEVTFQRVAFIQHKVLELDARVRWLGKTWQDKLADARARRKKHLTMDVVGAFVENLEDADLLFHAGIPVWLVRRVRDLYNPRVDEVVPVICEDLTRRIHLHCGHTLDCSDSTPPARIIYSGLANKVDRYVAMISYVQSQFQTVSLFGAMEPRRLKEASFCLNPSPQTTHLKANAYASVHRNQQQRKIVRGSSTKTDSDLKPKPVQNWEKAWSILHRADPQPMEVSRLGFRVPPAQCIVSPAKTDTVAKLFRAWLLIRPGILDNLGNPSSRVCVELSAKQWRSMLDVSGGLYAGDTIGSTRTARHHFEMRQLLEKARIDIGGPTTRLTYWRGEFVSSAEVPPQDIAREILWELCELNFRTDFIALDRVLDQSKMREVDRRQLLEKCWEGPTLVIDMGDAGRGLGAGDPRVRMGYLRCFHAIVRTWRGEKPAEVLDEFPKDNSIDIHNFKQVMDRVELALAHFYCHSFLQQYGRVGSIPHSL